MAFIGIVAYFHLAVRAVGEHEVLDCRIQTSKLVILFSAPSASHLAISSSVRLVASFLAHSLSLDIVSAFRLYFP